MTVNVRRPAPREHQRQLSRLLRGRPREPATIVRSWERHNPHAFPGRILKLSAASVALMVVVAFALLSSTPSAAQTAGVAGRYAGATSGTGPQVLASLTLSGPASRLSGFLSVFSADLASTLLQDASVTGTATEGAIALSLNGQVFLGVIISADTLSFDLGSSTLTLERLPERLDETFVGRLLIGLDLLDVILAFNIDNDVLRSTVNVVEPDGTRRLDDVEAIVGFSPSGAIEVNELLINDQPSTFSEVGVLLDAGATLLFRDLGRLDRFIGATETFRDTVADITTDPDIITTAQGEAVAVRSTTVIQNEQGIFLTLSDIALGALLEIRGDRLPLGQLAATTIIVISENAAASIADEPGNRVIAGTVTSVSMGGGTDRIIAVGVLNFTILEATPVARSDGAPATSADLAVGQSVRLEVDDQEVVISLLILGQGDEQDQPDEEQLEVPDEQDVPNHELDQLE